MKNSKSVIANRQKEILAYLQENNYASLIQIADLFNVSIATIRRDIAYLKKCEKVSVQTGVVELLPHYGKLPNFDSAPLSGVNELEKIAIAKRAADYLEDGDSIFINASSTALHIFPFIVNKSVTVITNNGRSLEAQRNFGTDLVIIGGEVGNSGPNDTMMKRSMTGELALDMIRKINTIKCILGVGGISVNGGLTSIAIQDPLVNKAMIQNCKGPVIVVADSRKIGIRHNFQFGSIHDITHLITDSKSNKEELQRIRDTGVIVDVIEVDSDSKTK